MNVNQKKPWKTDMKEEFIACKQEGHDCIAGIIKRVSWFKSSLLLRIKTVDITNINS